jgi:hypothetical protein
MSQDSVNVVEGIVRMFESIDCMTSYATNAEDLLMLMEEGTYTIYTFYKQGNVLSLQASRSVF